MVYDSPPQPLPQWISASTVNLISKMLRKSSVCRPCTDQLVLCPFLVPYIIRVYLNLGRQINLAEQEPESFGPHIFLKFLNSPKFWSNWHFNEQLRKKEWENSIAARRIRIRFINVLEMSIKIILEEC